MSDTSRMSSCRDCRGRPLFAVPSDLVDAFALARLRYSMRCSKVRSNVLLASPSWTLAASRKSS